MLSVTCLRFNMCGALGKSKYSEESVSPYELAHQKSPQSGPDSNPGLRGVISTTIRLSGSAATILYSPFVLPMCAPCLRPSHLSSYVHPNSTGQRIHVQITQCVLSLQVFYLVGYCLRVFKNFLSTVQVWECAVAQLVEALRYK